MSQLPHDPTGYLASPKLDGCRCVWNGEHFVSRNGRIFNAPDWFTQGMPSCRLDGELYAGIDSFGFLVSQIQRKGSDWEGITYRPFDVAALRVPIEERLAILNRLDLPAHVQPIQHRPIKSSDDLDAMEDQIVSAGGEGVCLRMAGSFYTPNGFTKVKRLFPDLDRSHLD